MAVESMAGASLVVTVRILTARAAAGLAYRPGPDKPRLLSVVPEIKILKTLRLKQWIGDLDAPAG
jgi:hypothetical protein